MSRQNRLDDSGIHGRPKDLEGAGRPPRDGTGCTQAGSCVDFGQGAGEISFQLVKR